MIESVENRTSSQADTSRSQQQQQQQREQCFVEQLGPNVNIEEATRLTNERAKSNSLASIPTNPTDPITSFGGPQDGRLPSRLKSLVLQLLAKKKGE